MYKRWGQGRGRVGLHIFFFHDLARTWSEPRFQWIWMGELWTLFFVLSGWSSAPLFKFWMLHVFMIVMPKRERKVGWESSSAPLWGEASCFGPICKKKMVLTICSQESSVATNYIYIYLDFLHHLLICRHNFWQPVWLIQVKLDAFSQQVLLHEPTFHLHTHILVLLISMFPGGSEILSFS